MDLVNASELISGIVETYQKYGWQLRRVLLRPETRAELDQHPSLGTAETADSAVDGLWFSRSSHNNREAWNSGFWPRILSRFSKLLNRMKLKNSERKCDKKWKRVCENT